MKLIGLDVGTKRIGVAKADTNVRIAVPDGIIMVNGQEFAEVARLARLYDTNLFVIGLPRNNQGEETAQTAYVRNFAKQLAQTIPNAKIRFQDESLTSVEAEDRLKHRRKNYQKGEIDAEAATIILQDFIENFTNNRPAQVTEAIDLSHADPDDFTAAPTPVDFDYLAAEKAAVNSGKTTPTYQQKQQEEAEKVAQAKVAKAEKEKKSMAKKLIIALVVIIFVFAAAGAVAYFWYDNAIKAPDSISCALSDESLALGESTNDEVPDSCKYVKFTVKDNETPTQIASNLESAGLIRSASAFRIYIWLTGHQADLKYGDYDFRKIMSTPDIVDQLVKGAPDSDVFNFTILPGDTIMSIKAKLLRLGYSSTEIDTAFAYNYATVNDNLAQLLATKPETVSYEGYLYGDTYQFYNGETVDNIIIRAMTELWSVVQQNDLITKYQARGLTLHQGITLASIVQKEAKTNDQAAVAQVFYNRIRMGWPLGSDVTATYAADLVDPERTVYTDNAAVLAIDSLYNTRIHDGLPPGPISNPGISALLAVANPDESHISDYYFLTGDDGVMYYSSTEEGHNQNRIEHCQELCNVSL